MTDERESTLLHAMVQLVLALRAEYLRSGANALKHWDQIQARLLVAAKTSTSAGDFVTRIAERLQLEAPSKTRSGATVGLRIATEELRPVEWLEWVEDNVALIMASATLEADRRREAREEHAKKPEEQSSIFKGGAA